MAVIHFLGYLTFIAEIFLYNSLDFVLLLFMGHSDDAALARAARLLLPRTPPRLSALIVQLEPFT